MSGRDRAEEKITVRVPDELPVLTKRAARILLDILVELTEVEVLDGPRERGSDDC
ncbi:hypothetical protein Atai01_78550 [Amycolatopsis taiwanensis]|uniref:Uncharacterized protein n=1 Tax=Amycolatopsis taiwanensis TaxID=342230 RepID=A0A9W6R8Q8_9PSEU|nr:hypothetical protein Atai01_78550 [Amycolatopsis taiwanensis]